MIVLEKPNFPPHVCLICGVGGTSRQWYVDLQLPIDNYFNPVNAGAVYICNEDWESLATEVNRQVQELQGTIPWDSPEFVKPTYNDDSPLIPQNDKNAPVGNQSPPELDFTEENSGIDTTGLSFGSNEGIDTGPATDDRPTERDSETPEPDSTDEQTEPVREFREHFGTKS